MHYFSFIFLFFFVGCSAKAPTGAFLEEFNTGYAGYAWEFKSDDASKSIWQTSISFVQSDYLDSDIKDVDYEAFATLRDTLQSSKFIVMWFTKGWQEYYFNVNEIQKAMNHGKIPVFLYWYFGDEFAQEHPRKVVEAHYNDYLQMNQRIINFLNQLEGEAIVLFEPEFNKRAILEHRQNRELFTRILSDSIDDFRANTSPNLKLYLGISMNDNGSKYRDENFGRCGYAHCALGDKHTWHKSIDMMKAFSDKLDVVAFSLMLSPFSRGTDDPNEVQQYSDERLGIGYLPERIANLSHELHTTLGKPVFLSHLVMASGTWQDHNHNRRIENEEINAEGWNEAIYKTYANFDYERFRENGMFGLALMNLFDNPKHDLGGYQYFLHNEHHLGLISSSVDPESQEPNDGQLRFKSHKGVRLIDLIYRR